MTPDTDLPTYLPHDHPLIAGQRIALTFPSGTAIRGTVRNSRTTEIIIDQQQPNGKTATLRIPRHLIKSMYLP